MKRFVEGEDRSQSTLFPSRLDDYVADNNPVRFVDAFIDRLPLFKLGFEGVEPQATGRPAYHPSVMLKLYVYGYLNRVQFRRDHGEALRNVCRQFVLLCRERLDARRKAAHLSSASDRAGSTGRGKVDVRGYRDRSRVSTFLHLR